MQVVDEGMGVVLERIDSCVNINQVIAGSGIRKFIWKSFRTRISEIKYGGGGLGKVCWGVLV